MHLDDPKTRARFEAKVDRSGDCHLWKAAHIPDGHGVFWLGKPVEKLVYAHRIALEYKLGRQLADDELATHTCDVGACVNPDHLESGDHRKNMADAVSRSRTMHGARHYLTHLTEQNVREIIALLATPGTRQEDIARRYEVSRAAIAQIKSGRSWKHVPRLTAAWPGRGETHPARKLDGVKVREILLLLANPQNRIMDIAAQYGITPAAVSNIKAGRTWRHISRPADPGPVIRRSTLASP